MDQALAKRIQLMASDPRYFLKYACYTTDVYDQANPVKRFPWDRPYIRAIVNAWLDHPLNVIEKSRGMVMSIAMCALHLHAAFTRPHQQIFILAKNFEFAEKGLKRMIVDMYEAIPEDVWPKDLRPSMRVREGELEFPEIKSFIKVVPSGVNVLRGFSATHIMFDEFDFLEDNEETFMASRPTARSGGRLTILSTFDKTKANDLKKRIFLRLIDDED